MTPEQIKKLRQFYHSIRAQAPIFREVSGNISHEPVNILKAEVDRLLADFPGIVPMLDIQVFFSHSHGKYSYYDSKGITAYLATVLGRLEIEIDDVPSTPVTQSRSFGFITNAGIRKIIERDFSEVQKAFVAGCWKSVIILCGGMIEAVLTDILLKDPNAKTSPKAPKNPDITRWDLVDLINVAVDLELVGAGVEKLSHSVRDYRNLIHPGNEMRNKLAFGPEEARIALEVLNILHRELT